MAHATRIPSPILPAPSDLSMIARQKFRDEGELVHDLLQQSAADAALTDRIEHQAITLVEGVRARKQEQPLLDAFLKEFGLSNEEGIALMCLAEALLRVPDGRTADELIADKIATGHWDEHQGHADSLFVNASTWALMLTGQVISLDRQVTGNPGHWFQRLTKKMGTPVIRRAMVQAMRIMGAEFVLGRTIDEAVSRGQKEMGHRACFSFDMLGEGARDRQSAERYFNAYASAIDKVAEQNSLHPDRSPSSISIKLSALHPRYEHSQIDRVTDELYTALEALCLRAAQQDVAVTIDAEEADRLELSLILFERLARNPGLTSWQGLGIVVQAYGKRALPVLHWLINLARDTGRRFPVRLVKGAYWDSEIKKAQEQGLVDFPVFTRKENTDLSYQVCARLILSARQELYGQFATHNAHTIATILALSDDNRADDNRAFEFQRLHGMGKLLYDQACKTIPDFPPIRTYAPVGGHEDLLAYLVRRLLENGANSSFVNRFMDASVPARDIVQDPAGLTRRNAIARNDRILLPHDLFGAERKNSIGEDLHCCPSLDRLKDGLQSNRRFISAGPIVNGQCITGTPVPVNNPATAEDSPGQVTVSAPDHIDAAFTASRNAQPGWDATGGPARAAILRRSADLLEERRTAFYAILIREAGKSWSDAVDEVREAVDFLRYYAARAEQHFGTPSILPGPTGEENCLSLHGRGSFVCISPWNFPLAIFTGQVAAALASGNAVLAKPAEQTPLVAFEAVRLFHEAGVPVGVLHLLPGDGMVGAALVSHRETSGVAFTGSTETARLINRTLAEKDGPIVPLIAETGGQNVMIVDSTALPEQVTDDVIRSAFGSAGQRCSALRLLYLQDDIADRVLPLIKGAMAELSLGDPWHHRIDMGPVIDQQALDGLKSHITEMAAQGFKAYTPSTATPSDGTFLLPHLIELDSINRLQREQFGPILHVVRFKADELDRHLAEARATGYGLTFGLHSRIESKAERLAAQAPVGNVYINRNMVGAVVGVQPFGGQGLSGTGPKAGGPHYLFRFATEKTVSVNTMASGGNTELLSL